MDCLDKFKTKMKYYGASLREENLKNSRDILSETFCDDLSFTNGVYLWSKGKLLSEDYEDDEQIKIRLFKRAFSSANGNTVKFVTMHDTKISVGTVLYDSNSGEYYICTESFDDDSVSWSGKLTLCNWILRWQDNNYNILSYPCYVINATQYNSGEQANKNFTVGSSQYIIFLPYDENTISLKSPQRFFMDKDKTKPTSYIVTQNDNTTYNYGDIGIVKLTVFESEKDNANDSIELGVCDYVDKNNSDNKDNENNLKSSISYETDIIKSGGDSQIFTAEFYDENGNIVDIDPKWNIICDFEDKLEVSKSDNSISIGIDNDYYVDETFKLVLSDDNSLYHSELLIKIESLL